MAKNKKNKAEKSPNTQGSDNQKGKNGFVFGLLAFLIALSVMLIVFTGAFYIVVHNNVNGITTMYRKDIQNAKIMNIHFLSWALPKLPKGKDPEDPKNLTTDQLKKKYNELRKLNDSLNKQLKDANKNIDELQKIKVQQDKIKAENAKLKKNMDTEKAKVEAQKKKNEEEKKKISELIATGDKTGFQQYFEKVDPATAQRIYAQILNEKKATDAVKKLSKIYEGMDPSAAAKVLEGMGTSKIDLTVGILKNMNKDSAAQIIAAMSSTFSGNVTVKMSKP
ncbi:MAG TPA: DUF615 domain-containing protein [Clostridia bacterium]|nr:DUF615 domain-containing protein [Clostridia bacterium]